MVKSELKLANDEMRQQLDDELKDLLPLLNMKKNAYGASNNNA